MAIVFHCVSIVFPDASYSQYKIQNSNQFQTGRTSWAFAENEQNEEQNLKAKSALPFAVGLLIGPFIGGAIGAVIPDNGSFDKLDNAFRGIIIGASVFPFISYELTLKMRGTSRKSDRWLFSVGANFPYLNHDEAMPHTGYLFGISRYYHLGERFDFSAGVHYNLREFAFRNQKVPWYSWPSQYLRYCDIDFHIGYLDVVLAPVYHFKTLNNLNFGLGIGPAISVQVFDATNISILRTEENITNRDDIDFYYNDEEMSPSSPYLGYVLSFEVELRRIALQLRLKRAFNSFHEAYLSNEEMKIGTVEFTMGYFLN